MNGWMDGYFDKLLCFHFDFSYEVMCFSFIIIIFIYFNFIPVFLDCEQIGF